MRNLLITLTVVEILVVVVALATYLIKISRSLHAIAANLAKVTFGVRAVETQCASIGPNVVSINEKLTVIAGAVEGLADQTEALVGPGPA